MKNSIRLLAPFILLAALAALLPGQSANARITGNVKDEDGGYLSDATVTAINVANNAAAETITKKKGAFRFVALTPGIYQVSIDREGYQSFVASGIKLSAEQSVTLRIQLKKKVDPGLEEPGS